MLLLTTFKSTLGFESCIFCADGSTITKPDTTIDAFNITCQWLSDHLLSLDSESIQIVVVLSLLCLIRALFVLMD